MSKKGDAVSLEPFFTENGFQEYYQIKLIWEFFRKKSIQWLVGNH